MSNKLYLLVAISPIYCLRSTGCGIPRPGILGNKLDDLMGQGCSTWRRLVSAFFLCVYYTTDNFKKKMRLVFVEPFAIETTFDYSFVNGDDISIITKRHVTSFLKTCIRRWISVAAAKRPIFNAGHFKKIKVISSSWFKMLKSVNICFHVNDSVLFYT